MARRGPVLPTPKPKATRSVVARIGWALLVPFNVIGLLMLLIGIGGNQLGWVIGGAGVGMLSALLTWVRHRGVAVLMFALYASLAVGSVLKILS